MSVIKELFAFIAEYKKECDELKKWCSFSKRWTRCNNNSYDLLLVSDCHTLVSEEAIFQELNGLLKDNQNKKVNKIINSYRVEKNRIFLKIARSTVIKAVLGEIFEKQYSFGNSQVFSGQTYTVAHCETSRPLTQLRLATAAHVVEALITKGGGKVATDNAHTVWISPSNSHRQLHDYHILVNQANMLNVPDITEQDFMRLRREEVLAMGDHKDTPELSVDKLVNATIIFDLLSIKLEKPVILDSSLQPKSARTSNIKGAPFVLYNYARLCAILQRYDDLLVRKMTPPLQVDNYDCLSDDYEWSLVWDFLGRWPEIVAECQDLKNPKLHRIINFMSQLASTFSIYYRHTRVLTEGVVHMRPLMEARIHLLLALKQVFLNVFSILSVDPPTYM